MPTRARSLKAIVDNADGESPQGDLPFTSPGVDDFNDTITFIKKQRDIVGRLT
jgi:hypothetical protein